MNHFERSEKVTIENGELVRTVTGTVKNFSMEVAKIYESGKCMVRNIEPTPLNGWCMAIPGQRYSGGGWSKSYIAEIDPWWEFKGSHEGLSYYCYPDENDKETILSKYPDFKYVLKKAKLTNNEIFKALPIWKKNPSAFEALVSQGWKVLAFNTRTYSAKDKASIINFVRSHPDDNGLTLNDIRVCIQNRIEPEQLKPWKRSNGCNYRAGYLTYPEWVYLGNRPHSTYIEYMNMAKECGHDMKDPYWHFPKNLKKAHDKVMKEVMNVRAIKKAEEMKAKNEQYFSIVKKLVSKKLESRGLSVFVPRDVQTIARQAEALHQCLIAADYVGKVVSNKCILVFVEYKGEPLATAELVRKGKKFKLGQFYGDERKRDFEAPKRAKNALKKWIETFNIRMVA